LLRTRWQLPFLNNILRWQKPVEMNYAFTLAKRSQPGSRIVFTMYSSRGGEEVFAPFTLLPQESRKAFKSATSLFRYETQFCEFSNHFCFKMKNK